MTCANLGNLEDGYSTRLDFHGRFTRFCITSFAIRGLRTSPQKLATLHKDQITRCLFCANRLLAWQVGLGPVQKERLRYFSDSGFVMMTFCCFFVLSACQSFSSFIPDVFENLTVVLKTANLMIELEPKAGHKVNNLGRIILQRLESVQRAQENQKSLRGNDTFLQNGIGIGAESSDMSSGTFEEFDYGSRETGVFGFESLWDFSMIFPAN
jgi:hypothetical protein